VKGVLELIVGGFTVGLLGLITIYSLFIREWSWKHRLGGFAFGVPGTALRALYWFGHVDTVRASLFSIP